LFRDVAIFMTASGFGILLAGYCYATLADPARSADEKKWAMSFLSAVAGGLIGYLLRK